MDIEPLLGFGIELGVKVVVAVLAINEDGPSGGRAEGDGDEADVSDAPVSRDEAKEKHQKKNVVFWQFRRFWPVSFSTVSYLVLKTRWFNSLLFIILAAPNCGSLQSI